MSNNDLTELERSGAMPALDYTNPLHTFGTSTPAYTATKDCYLVGATRPISSSAEGDVSINGTAIASGFFNASETGFVFINIKLSAGDTVTTTAAANFTHLHVLDVLS